MKILIAIDESVESRDAVNTAFEMFGPDHDYRIMSVASTAPIYLSGYSTGGFTSSIAINDAVDRAQHEAEVVVAAAEDQLPVDAEGIVATGPVGATICARAKDSAVDVLVIGSHDRSLWDRLFSGPSVGGYVVQHSPCPVLVVRSD